MNKTLWILGSILLAISICGPVGDPDLWWHIVVGKWILAHGQVPQVDHWNEFAAGTPWRAYSWLNEIAYAWIDSAYGTNGLLAAKLFLSLCFVLCLITTASGIAKNTALGLLLGAAASIACYAHFGLRPQVISWICFALCLYSSEKSLRDGFSLPRGLLHACVMMLWANSHISGVFGLFGIILWTFDFTNVRTSLAVTSKLLLAALVGTMITPYIGAEWLTMLGKAQHPFAHMYIQEFQPATLYHAGANLVILLFATLLVLIHKNPLLLIPSQLCGAVVLLFAALSIQKFIPFAAIYLALLIARSWSITSDPEADFGNLGLGISRLSGFLKQPPLLFSLPSILLALLFIWGLMRPLIHSPLDFQSVAAEPLDFIQTNKLPTPILNTFNDGGYILYRFSESDGTPQLRVPIDGRTNINTREATLGFLAALRATPDWRSYFNLVKPETVLWENRFPLVSVLLEDEQWCHVFPEKTGSISSSRWSIFVRKQVFLDSSLSSRNCSIAAPDSESTSSVHSENP